MNSRFKFRVWDTDIKEYLVGEFLVGSYGDMIHDVVDYESFLNKGNYIIEQCTGLKDKNGNLIYEGDIVKCGNTTGVVKFGFYRKTDEHFPDSIYGFYIEWEKQCSFRQDFGYWTTEERIEIVGNIHTGIKEE